MLRRVHVCELHSHLPIHTQPSTITTHKNSPASTRGRCRCRRTRTDDARNAREPPCATAGGGASARTRARDTRRPLRADAAAAAAAAAAAELTRPVAVEGGLPCPPPSARDGAAPPTRDGADGRVRVMSVCASRCVCGWWVVRRRRAVPACSSESAPQRAGRRRACRHTSEASATTGERTPRDAAAQRARQCAAGDCQQRVWSAKACEISACEGARARVACWRDGRDADSRRQALTAVRGDAPGAEVQPRCSRKSGSALATNSKKKNCAEKSS